MRRDRAGNPEKALLAELEAVYADVAQVYAGWTCPASTECCHFAVTGREPYVTSIELLAITRAIAAMGGMKVVRRKAASDGSGGPTRLPLLLESADDRGRCPLLASSGRCSIYASRPLGCRTFYCDRASEGGSVRQRDVNELVRRIQAIAERHEASGERGRPLTRALAGAGARGRR